MEKDALEIFKKDLGTFVRFYEFMSQIVDYDDKNLEKLSLYARNLRPMLGDFTRALDDAIMDSGDAHQNQMMQLLSDPSKAKAFARVVFDLLKLAE